MPKIPPIEEPMIIASNVVNKSPLNDNFKSIIAQKIYVIRKYIPPVTTPFKRPYIGTFLDVKNPLKKLAISAVITERGLIKVSGKTDMRTRNESARKITAVTINAVTALIIALLESIVL